MHRVHDRAAASGSPEQLSRIDLNLLVAFDALAREGSVTRAAQRVGLTQSALSHALRRLRELLDDPLLVRGQKGMVLTPRGEALVMPLRSGLVMLAHALSEPSAFAPASAQRTFCLASPDLFDAVVVPPLLLRVRDQAPGIDLSIVPVNDPQMPARLETGDVDFAVVPEVERSRTAPPQPAAQGLVRKRLFRDRYVCLLRADHPALRGKRSLSLEQYVALPHLLVAPRGAGLGPIDEALDTRGLRRRIALRIPNFLTGMAIVAESDLVLTAPSALAALAAHHTGIATLRPPLPLPEHSVNLIWHERFSNDPGHRWLRELIAQVAEKTPRDTRKA